VEQEGSDDGGENCDARIFFLLAGPVGVRCCQTPFVGSFSCPMTRKARTKAQSAALR